MPKLDATHLPERLLKRIEQLENDELLEARDINALLTPLQQQALKDLWKVQQDLRAIHKPPKTQEKKKLLGWKTIREVRLEIYEQALAELNDNLVDDIHKLQAERELKAVKVFMSAWSEAVHEGKKGLSAISAGNIAVTRARFNPHSTMGLSKRDKEIQKMEADIRRHLESELTDEEREQLEIQSEHEKSLNKRRK